MWINVKSKWNRKTIRFKTFTWDRRGSKITESETTSFMDDPSGLCMALLYTAAFVWNKGQKRPIGLHATIVFRMPPNSRVFSLISSFTCTVCNFRWNRKGNPCISYFILVLTKFCRILCKANSFRKREAGETCQDLSKIDWNCPNLSEIVQICPNLFQTCSNWSKPVQIGWNLSKLDYAASNGLKFSLVFVSNQI